VLRSNRLQLTMLVLIQVLDGHEDTKGRHS
jgi:hypothetical protein